MNMLPEGSSYDEFSYSPVDTVEVVAMSSAGGYDSSVAEVKRVEVNQNSQHELSPQQFVYVILTR